MFESNEQTRRDMIRQLEHEKEMTQADQARIDADFTERLGVIDGKLQRLRSQVGEGDICLECWVFHDIKSALESIPSPATKTISAARDVATW